mgnify:FL=1
MHFSCLSNGLNEDISYKVNKNKSGDKESVRKSCSARIFDEEVNVTNCSAENYHEPWEASHGARIMANEVGVSYHYTSFFSLKKVRLVVLEVTICYPKEHEKKKLKSFS